VTDSVTMNLRAAGSSERNFEMSVVYITWLDSWDGFMYSL